MSFDHEADGWLARMRGETLPARVPAAEKDPAIYQAWGKGHPEAVLFDVRLRPDEDHTMRSELLPLHYLMRISCTASPRGDAVSLAFADCIIVARGRNLGPLKPELVAGKVHFIEQFDPGRWPEPEDPDAPVITDIDVIAPGRAKAS